MTPAEVRALNAAGLRAAQAEARARKAEAERDRALEQRDMARDAAAALEAELARIREGWDA